MKPEIVFAIYKPHQNKGNELKKLILKHVPILKSNKLITNREPVLVQSKNGIYIDFNMGTCLRISFLSSFPLF
jgi:hypothetical protein